MGQSEAVLQRLRCTVYDNIPDVSRFPSCFGFFRAEGTVLDQPRVQRRERSERRATLGLQSDRGQIAPPGRP